MTFFKLKRRNPNWPRGVTPNEKGEVPKGLTVLLRAILDNNLEVASLLLTNGADPNLYEKPAKPSDIDENGNLYYYENAWKEDDSLFEEKLYQCPLSAALKKGNKEMIQLLKFHGATVNTAIDFKTYFSLNPNDLLDAEAWDCITDELGNDKEFVMKAVKKNYLALKHVSDALKNDSKCDGS